MAHPEEVVLMEAALGARAQNDSAQWIKGLVANNTVGK